MLGCCYSEILNNFIREPGLGSEVREAVEQTREQRRGAVSGLPGHSTHV